jgi:hypothetical protein
LIAPSLLRIDYSESFERSSIFSAIVTSELQLRQAGYNMEVLVEKEASTGPESPRLVRKHMGWCGRFDAGEWYCKCDRKAKLLPTVKKNHNEGRWCKDSRHLFD